MGEFKEEELIHVTKNHQEKEGEVIHVTSKHLEKEEERIHVTNKHLEIEEELIRATNNHLEKEELVHQPSSLLNAKQAAVVNQNQQVKYEDYDFLWYW